MTLSTVAPSGEIAQVEQDLVDELTFFDDWMDRYQHLIELGRDLPAFPDEWKREENLLQGCQSQVWMIGRWRDGRLRLAATSDAAIVSGLITLLIRLYDGRTAEEILGTPPDFINKVGLDSHLSPTRSNGLHAMISAIMAMARTGGGRGVGLPA